MKCSIFFMCKASLVGLLTGHFPVCPSYKADTLKMAPNSIHWFRKGLRLHDNPALQEAVRGAGTIRCVYFLDPWFAGSSNLGVNRWR